MVRDPQSDRTTLGILESLRCFFRGLQDKGVRPRSERPQGSVLLIVHARVLGDLGQVAADQREMMMLVRLTDSRDALHGGFVADMTTKRVTRIGRIHDDAAFTQYRHRLLDQASL